MEKDTEKSAESADGNPRATEKVCLRLALVEKVLAEGDLAVRWNGEVHLYHVSDVKISGTRGSLRSMDITPSEKAKIDCCTHLFNDMSTAKVKYYQVTKYQDLIDKMTEIK